MEQKKIKILLKQLKQLSFITLRTFKQVNIKKTHYFSWHEDSNFHAFDLTQGLGGIDQHFQISLDIDKSKFNTKDIDSLYLWVETGDTDIWNTNNPQFLALVNKKIIRALDMNHHYFHLPTDSENKWKILLNLYTNTKRSDIYIDISIKKRNNLFYHFYYKLKNLWETLQIINKNEPNYLKITQIIQHITKDLDIFHLTEEQIRQADNTLVSYLKNNASNSLSIIEHVIGHTHIDLSWLWGIQQTKEKVIRSFSNALYLLESYQDMTFMSSSPILYEFLEELEPDLFSKVCNYIENNRWFPEGGMYVESDINLPSGESLIRQILYGKKYFKSKFNIDSKILWLPDCFGFSASLPQIMKKSGLDFFFTSKMDWNDTNKIPDDTFLWEGIDGSKVLSQFLTTSDYSPTGNHGTTYNGRLNASQIKGTWSRYQNKDLSTHVLQIYGFGDGGGGPTDEMLENSMLFSKKIPSLPQIVHSSPLRFFEDLKNSLELKVVPTWTGELYLENHRGTYTTDAQLKKLNREVENYLIQSETILSIVNATQSANTENISLESTWKPLLINQFHDILPGTSIWKVHHEAVNRYKKCKENSTEILKKNLRQYNLKNPVCLNSFDNNDKISGKKIILFNTTSFKKDLVLNLNDKDYLIKDIPPSGYKYIETETIIKEKNHEKKLAYYEHIKDILHIETQHYILEINQYGGLSKCFSKELNRNIISKSSYGNQFWIYPDYPEEYDAWNLDREDLQLGKPLEEDTSIQVKHNSPYKTIVEIKKHFRNSIISQQIILYKHSKRIDFKTEVIWEEKHTLLKVKFPTNIQKGTATYDIQFGNIQRDNHKNTNWNKAKFEVCAHKWIDLSENNYGISLLNNCKYGHIIQESDMYITLLRSPQYPAKNIDMRTHEFIYSLLPHKGDFSESNTYSEAYDLNYPTIGFTKTSEEPFLSSSKKSFSLIEISNVNIICETIKKSEDGPHIILRLYETIGRSTNTKIHINCSVEKIIETNLIEADLEEILHTDNTIYLSFSPFEIKTIRLIMK